MHGKYEALSVGAIHWCTFSVGQSLGAPGFVLVLRGEKRVVGWSERRRVHFSGADYIATAEAIKVGFASAVDVGDY